MFFLTLKDADWLWLDYAPWVENWNFFNSKKHKKS